MENASVKPSRRAWSAVRSSLDAVAFASRRDMWPRMAWMMIPAAAALCALGIFLFKPVPSATVISGPVALNSPQTFLIVGNIPAPGSLASLPERPVCPSCASKPESAVTGVADEIADVTAIMEKSVKEESQSVSSQFRSSREEVQNDGTRTWEEYLKEEEKKYRSTRSLFAKGSIGSNDSDILVNFGGTRMSPGSSIQSGASVTELGESTFGVPFSIGMGARIGIAPRLSIGTGLEYTLLTRTFEGNYKNAEKGLDVDGSIKHAMHYIGIPLNAYFDIVLKEKFRFYAYVGGEGEKCIANNYIIRNADKDYTHSAKVKSLQWSVGAGVGIEYMFNSLVGVYLDPGVRYFFNCDQPKSIRTERPIMVNFDAGVRFSL